MSLCLILMSVQALKGYVRVGKINCQSYQSTCGQASIQSYPSLRIYKGTETKGYSQVSIKTCKYFLYYRSCARGLSNVVLLTLRVECIF